MVYLSNIIVLFLFAIVTFQSTYKVDMELYQHKYKN